MKILKTYESFINDADTFDACVRRLEIIGEAANNIPAGLKISIDLPWSYMISMRNKVIHEYFGIDPEILWQTAKEDIPELKKKINNLKT